MGMFDWIKCEATLPDGYKPKRGLFQTKHFECGLETITITEGGRLIGSTGDLAYHGVFNFYDYSDNIWREYRAKFTNGQLESIIKMKEAPDADTAR